MPNLIIKPGVDLTNLRPKITSIIWPVAELFFAEGFNCVITSARRAWSEKRSLHTEGLALDFRGKHIPTDERRKAMLEKIRKTIGDKEYDFVLYDLKDGGHIHIEYDPK